MTSPPEPTTGQDRPEPAHPAVLSILALVALFSLVALSGCSWFGGSDDDGGTVIADNGDGDGGSDDDEERSGDSGGNDDDGGDTGGGDDDGGDNDDEEALAVIRDAAVDSGVAPDQRSGTLLSLPVNGCHTADSLAERDIESLPGNYLFVCLQSTDDYWEFELVDPAGRSVTTTWSSTGFFDRSFSFLEPAGAYLLVGRARSGATVEAEYDFGSPLRLALEAATVDGSQALVLAGYGDGSELLLAAYDATGIGARMATQLSGPVLQFDDPLPHITDLGPVPLDPDGLTVIPIGDSDVESYCIFAASSNRLSESFACFGVEPATELTLAMVDDGASQLSRAVGEKLGRSDIWVAAPVTSTLADGTVVTAATVTELESGRPIAAAGFVAEAKGGQPELFSLVEDSDFVSSFATVCKDLAAGFKLRHDPCTERPPIIVFIDPTLDVKLLDVVPAKKDDLRVDEFDVDVTIRPDVILDPEVLRKRKGG